MTDKTPWVISQWHDRTYPSNPKTIYLIDSADALFPEEDLVELMGSMVERRSSARIVWLTYRPDPSEGEELWQKALRDFQGNTPENTPDSPGESATLEVQQQTS